MRAVFAAGAAIAASATSVSAEKSSSKSVLTSIFGTQEKHDLHHALNLDFSALLSRYGFNVAHYTAEELEYFRANFRRHAGEVGSVEHDIGALLASADPAVTAHKLHEQQQVKASASRSGKPTFQSELSPRFRGLSTKDVKKLQGTFLTGPYAKKLDDVVSDADYADKQLSDPVNFDVREKFSQCKNVVGHIRDQATCGSCWAFGSTEAMNDRLCIASQGKFQTLLSPQHTASCCALFEFCLSFGCGGGNPMMAWFWFVHHGVVTGGDYDDNGKSDTCWPYQITPCNHHSEKPDPSKPDCDKVPDSKTPRCVSSCINKSYTNPFKSDKHKASKSYMVVGNTAMKQQLQEKGSLTAAFTVYDDFLNYKSGVYTVGKGAKPLGGHAVKMIGFGHDEASGLDYWLVANSWGTQWGDQGTFKIAVGEAGIENMIAAGDVQYSQSTNADEPIYV